MERMKEKGILDIKISIIIDVFVVKIKNIDINSVIFKKCKY